MKITLKSIIDRITAVFLFILFMEISVALVLGISCMYDYHFYASDRDMFAQQAAYEVKTDTDLQDLTRYALLTLKKEKQPLTLTEQNALNTYAVRYAPTATNLRYSVSDGTRMILQNETPAQETLAYQRFDTRTIYSDQGEPTTLSIRMGVTNELGAKDVYRTVHVLIRVAISVRYVLIGLLVVTSLFALLILGALMSSVEVTDEDGTEKKASFIDRIPLDLLILMLLGVFSFSACWSR